MRTVVNLHIYWHYSHCNSKRKLPSTGPIAIHEERLVSVHVEITSLSRIGELI